MGNVVLANDTAALVHPELSDKTIEAIGNALKVEVRRGTIGGVKTVGMAGVATNKGLLVNPRATASRAKYLRNYSDFLWIGTHNYGSQMVGSGLIANTRGYVASPAEQQARTWQNRRCTGLYINNYR
ncbi:MAG: translation initiation factor IF-6 [Methanolobus sp.]